MIFKLWRYKIAPFLKENMMQSASYGNTANNQKLIGDIMTTYYIGSNASTHWQKTNAKTLNGAKALATKEYGVSCSSKLEVAELTDYGYEQIAVKHGYDKWRER